MRNVSKIDTSTNVFGKHYPFPVAIAPSAMHQLAHAEGELATARAAASQGTSMTLSTFSNASLEDVIEAGQKIIATKDMPRPEFWLQLYCFQNRKISEDLIRRAELAGYKAIVLTVDTPYLGTRYNEIRNKMSLPSHVKLGNFISEEATRSISKISTDSNEKDGSGRLRSSLGGPITGPLKHDNGMIGSYSG
jgi:(S)-2-hydroxy-acid oxidase